jgi:hypothetical protein
MIVQLNVAFELETYSVKTQGSHEKNTNYFTTCQWTLKYILLIYWSNIGAICFPECGTFSQDVS